MLDTTEAALRYYLRNHLQRGQFAVGKRIEEMLAQIRTGNGDEEPQAITNLRHEYLTMEKLIRGLQDGSKLTIVKK